VQFAAIVVPVAAILTNMLVMPTSSGSTQLDELD
jgi:hypothetical protein